MTGRQSVVVAAAIGLLLLACGGAAPSSQPSPSSSPNLSGTLTVLAAASLTGAFTKIGDQLHAKNPDLDVRSVLSKVSLGEADAGIVYVTDVKAAGGGVTGVQIPDDLNVTADYPIVRLKSARNQAAARAFLTYVTGSQGQTVLKSFGFITVG